MMIWIDADACPRPVKDTVFRASERLEIAVRLVANAPMPTPSSPFVDAVLVEGGPDVADDYIAAHVQPGDLVVTADVPLAGDVVARGAVAIDPRGTIYSEDTIGERLPMRDLLMELRDSGLIQGGPPPFRPIDKRRFAEAFDRLLTRTLREQGE